jgi:membrane protease YdiL (CAAX protease family)
MFVGWMNRFFIISNGETAAANEGIALSTLAALRAVRATYGVGALLICGVALAPLAEEFIFRGVVLQGIGRHVPFWFANIVQSCLFALIHDDLKLAPFLITMALLVGILRRRTQSIAAGTLLHALNNLIALSALPS